jgi:glutaredoxin 3
LELRSLKFISPIEVRVNYDLIYQEKETGSRIKSGMTIQMTIKLYKTTTCPYCKQEGEYLTSKGVKFEEIYVDKDPKAAEEMVKISGQMGVPLTLITKDDGTVESILGFDREKLNAALGISE